MSNEKTYNASCLRGHVQRMSRAEMVSFFGTAIIGEIDAGKLLSAPMLPLSECYDCTLERERQDRLTNELLVYEGLTPVIDSIPPAWANV